jgi:AcrR family transcriptional regulator
MARTGKPRGPYANTPIQQEKILRGALEYFGQFGYWGSSMRDIAGHIGMSQASMRHYFATKTELLTAVLEERDQISQEVIRKAEIYNEYFVDAIAQIVIDNVEQPNIVRLFTTLSAEATNEEHPAHPFFAERYRRVAESISTLLSKAAQVGEISPAVATADSARVVLSVMFGLQVQWLLDPSIDMADLFKKFLAQYLGAGRDTEPVRSGKQSKTAARKRKAS